MHLTKEQYNSRVEAGICTKCDDKAGDDITLCMRHLMLNRARVAASKKKNIKVGLCPCGRINDNPGGTCKRCRKLNRIRSHRIK